MKKLFILFIIIISGLIETQGTEIKPYGFIELYGWYNDCQLLGHELYLLVKNEKHDGSMGMTAKNTRVGVSLKEKLSEKLTLNGKIEVDFWGNYTGSSLGAEGQSMPRMRHAFIDLNFGQYGLIFGNTWSIVSSLIFPSLVNPGAGWSQGKLWQRFPQIQFYANKKINGNILTGLKLAAARSTTGSSYYKNQLLNYDVDAGDASKLPRFESQIFISKKLQQLSYLLSFSYIYGKEDFSKAIFNSEEVGGKEVDVSGFNTSLSLDLMKKIYIKGEFYQGKNLNAYGSIGSSHNDDSYVSIPTRGFWMELGVTPIEALTLCAGTGQDDPDEDDEDLKNNFLGAYTKNQAFWGAVKWKVHKKVVFHLEYTNLTTERNKTNQENTGNIILFSTKYYF